uniref:Chemokine (C-C motif) ligand 34b, duplicate 4 n=1 Tax=Cyprinus carpio TaxID=7962 RepID=A0A8C1U253_CYPCA
MEPLSKSQSSCFHTYTVCTQYKISISFSLSDRRPTRVGVSCCKEVSKARIPPAIKLIGYKHQNALSPCVDAIIFYTEKEKYCSDPKARWIKDRLKGLELIMD